MANRRFEMYQDQQILSRMRLGDSDRDLARAQLIGRKKAAKFRLVAEKEGWLDPAHPLPDVARITTVLDTPRAKPAVTSLVAPPQDRVLAWTAAFRRMPSAASIISSFWPGCQLCEVLIGWGMVT